MRSKEGSERGIFIYLQTYIYSSKSKGKQVNILVLSVGDCLILCQTYVVTQTSSNTSQVVLERVFSSLLLHQTTLESVQLEIGFK